jgi:osmotically-inducible protein OsmY
MRIQFFILTAAALAFTSLLSACGILAVGGIAAGAAVMADRRPPAVQAIDKGIDLEASNALVKLFGENAHIKVTSFNQKVLVTGEAKDIEIKERAGDYVKSMKNVRSVFNELLIAPNSSLGARANDAYLVSKIKTQMIFTEQLPSNSMAIVAEGGSIYLMGILTQNGAGLAKRVSSNSNGVKNVYAYFDIISEAEKKRLEKAGKAVESQPTTTPNN